MATRLIDVAKVIRSKNAGPLHVTIDLMFSGAEEFRAARASANLTPNAIARLYGIDEKTVEVIAYPAAHAVKIVMDRPIIAGSPGDRDVYGAQQHGPLLEVEL